MRWILLGVLVLAPATAMADGEAAAAKLAECVQLEELCEQTCLNLDEPVTDEQATTCYLECGSRGESCRAAAQ